MWSPRCVIRPRKGWKALFVFVRYAEGDVSGLNGRAERSTRYGLGLGRVVGLVSGVGARNRPYPTLSKPRFRWSERYLDVKRRVRRGT